MKKRCNGPRGADSFNITCDRAKEPPFAVDWLVKHFGSQVWFVFASLLLCISAGRERPAAERKLVVSDFHLCRFASC